MEEIVIIWHDKRKCEGYSSHVLREKILIPDECMCPKSRPTFCKAMDCSLPGSSVHRILSPGKNTGGGFHAFLQGIFLTQRSTLHILHWRWILYTLSLLGSPIPSAYIRKEERLKINDLAFYLKNLEKIKHKEWKRKEKVKKKKK